jgi:hypothetical protein
MFSSDGYRTDRDASSWITFNLHELSVIERKMGRQANIPSGHSTRIGINRNYYKFVTLLSPFEAAFTENHDFEPMKSQVTQLQN